MRPANHESFLFRLCLTILVFVVYLESQLNRSRRILHPDAIKEKNHIGLEKYQRSIHRINIWIDKLIRICRITCNDKMILCILVFFDPCLSP